MDDAFERERQRQLHRAHLGESRRRAALGAARGERRRSRLRSAVPVALSFVLLGALAIFAGGLTTVAQEGNSSDPVFFPTLVAGSATVDELRVRGSIRVVDAAGRELAVLGPEVGEGGKRGPIVLGMYTQSPNGPQQTLRIASSDSGAALSVRTPDGRSAVTLLAGARGPEIEILDGATKRVLSEEAHPAPGAGPHADATPSAPKSVSHRPIIAQVQAPKLPAVGASNLNPAATAYEVDLNVEAIQPIGHGMLVVGLDAADRGGVVRIVGRIINTTSVIHRAIDFRIGVGTGTAPFTIGKISPGNSTAFMVDVPDVTVAEIDSAKLEYLGSTIRYHAHSTKGEFGRVTLR